MRNYIVLLGLGFLCLMSCQDAVQSTAASVKTVASKTASTATNKVMGAAVTALDISISSITANRGEQACVSFVVNDFKGILGYQHSINFNPKELKYVNSSNYGLANLNDSNFGVTKAEQGQLNFLWFDMNVKGVSIADKTKLYDICFETLAPKGTKCEVSITDKPLKKEVVGPQKKKLNLNSNSGFINVK